MTETDSIRRNDIDWLRIFATYLLFFFHAAMIFSPAPFFHVRNAEVAFPVLVFAGFVSLWHMPLFFVLAGWSILSSLRTRGVGSFVGERVRRLLIPLMAGVVLFGPMIKYLELRTGLDMNHAGLRATAEMRDTYADVMPEPLPVAPSFDETFAEFVPTFFTDLERFTWSHLWFVAYLFTFSLLYCGVFARLARAPAHQGPPARVGAAWVYAPIVPLALIQVLLRPHWPGIQNLYDDWANFAFYSTFLTLGFLLARFPAFEDAVHRESRRAALTALAVVLLLLAGLLGAFRSDSVMLAGSAAAGWLLIVAILGFARRRLTADSAALEYLRESAMPVYILHQPAVVVFGYVVVGWSLGISAKFVLIVAMSIVATVSFYLGFVRYVPFLRAIFGMKPVARDGVAPAVRYASAALLVLALLVASAARAAESDPVGLWWAEGGAAKVEVSRCGQQLCATVAWLRHPFDEHGCELRDDHNPDDAMRARPVVGVRILDGLHRSPGEEAAWSGGAIYDPGSGNTYRCSLRMDGTDRIRIRGYVGLPIFGRTTTWIRVGAEQRTCTAAADRTVSLGEDTRAR